MLLGKLIWSLIFQEIEIIWSTYVKQAVLVVLISI